MERKLATVSTILDIKKIEKAQNLELATVRGWLVIVGKGEFKPGDKCVFFEIDSYLPLEERYSFLSDRCQRGDGYLIKTIKLRGQISQGLIMPLGKFPEFSGLNFVEDEDVTEILKVKKYGGLDSNPQGKGAKFPHFLVKTNLERIQNLSLEHLKLHRYEKTLKLDGSSMTIYFYNGKIGVCSKNCELDPEDKSNPYIRAFNSLNLELNLNIGIQGELVGENIQSNRGMVEGLKFVVYSIFDIDRQVYFSPDQSRDFCKKTGLLYVPVISTSEDISSKSRQDLIQEAMNIPYEGFVYKSLNGEIRFKVINNNYLLNNSLKHKYNLECNYGKY